MNYGGNLKFAFTPYPGTGVMIFTGLKGSASPEGFSAVYDEGEKAVTLSGRLTLDEFLDLAKFLEAGEKLKNEWEGPGGAAEERDGAAS